MGVLVEENQAVLEQGSSLLEQIDDATYVELTAKRKLGNHFRHCLDFYQCFLRGLEQGVIDYDRRDRDSSVETSRAAALNGFRSLIDRLGLLPRREAQGVQVTSKGYWTSDDLQTSSSSVERELQFLQSHTIHHYALIASVLRERGVPVDSEFGVSPSTLRHEAAARESARPDR